MESKKIALELINKLSNSDISSISEISNLKNKNVYFFFKFIIEIDLNVLDSIYFVFLEEIRKFYNLNIMGEKILTLKEYALLNSIYLIKSINISIVEEIDSFVDSDKIISNHLSLEVKMWMFLTNKDYYFLKQYKKIIFKIYSILVLKKVLCEKIINNNLKTIKEWSIKGVPYYFDIYEKFKIEHDKLSVVKIEDVYYLKGSFFNNFCELYKKNIYSNYNFEFKSDEFVNKLLNTCLYFDEESFNDIYKLFSEDNVVEKFKDLSFKMKKLKEDRNTLIELNKEDYVYNMKEMVVNDMKLLNFCSVKIAFKKYLFDWNWEKKKFRNIDFIWNVIEKDIENKIKKIKEDDMIKLIADIGDNLIEESVVSEKVDEKEVRIFVDNNINEIILYYKNLRMTKNFSINYYLNMNEVRKYESEWVVLQKEFSFLFEKMKLYYIFLIKEELVNKKIYFPFFFDFRGRLYFDSQIGITNFKLARFFYYYGEYSDSEIKKLSEIQINFIHKYNNVLNDAMVYFKIDRNNNAIKEGIFWIIIAIGKEFIDKSKPYCTLQEIIDKGIEKIIEDDGKIDDLEKRISVMHYKRVLNSLKSKSIKKRFIHKDATASFIQNTIRIIGPKNEKSLEYANLSKNDRWYDTYTLALLKWKDSIKSEDNCIKINDRIISTNNLKYFTRKTIKKPIMTGPYEARFLTKWEYFKKDVMIEFGENIEINSEVGVLFKNFMDFLDLFWEEYYLVDNSNKMIEYIMSNPIIEYDDSKTNLSYYKLKQKRIDVKIKQNNGVKRKTKVYYEVDKDNIDVQKMKNSIKANWVHFSDGLLIRQINFNLEAPLLSIHDCFLVDVLSVSKFIIIANKQFKETKNLSKILKNNHLLESSSSMFIFF